MDRTCHKCSKCFERPYLLNRHLARKTPCDPIIETPIEAEQENACKYCGRSFASKISMYRHIRQSCKIANSEEGMDKLMERTVQRQLAAQSKEMADMKAQNTRMEAQMAELATLLRGQLTAGAIAPLAEQIGQVNNGPVTNIGKVTTQVNHVVQVINITPWDGDKRISVGVRDMLAAFAENPRLKEYTRFGDHELTDPEIAPPYVTELLMDLVKRAHADPAARNVYLNPRRADQALVHLTSGRWEVLPLQEATRLLFDGVAKQTHRVVMTFAELKLLPLEAQNALSMAGLLYDEEPDEYARRAKGPMAAHLVNTAPTLCAK